MNQENLAKPENLDEETWEQHLNWMSVMGRQVEENFLKHQQRLKEDAKRREDLRKYHQEVLQGQHRVQSLFCK
jgi:asparagine synthetase A